MKTYSTEDIARYAEAEMEGQELLEFEENLQADSNLRKQLDFYYNVQQTLKMKLAPDKQDMEFKHTLNQLNGQYFKAEVKVVSFKSYTKWLSAAAAILIVVFIWAPWKNTLYQEYAATEMVTLAERGERTNLTIDDAATAFNNKDFAAAEKQLEVLVKANPADALAQYYYGISLLETDKLPAARKVLNTLYKGASVFKYDAAFYIALSYLKEKDKETCKQWLLKIPADAANYQKARELLERL